MKKQLTIICIIGILLVVGLSGCLNGNSNPEIHLFTVTPNVIIQGDKAVISWSVTNADKIDILEVFNENNLNLSGTMVIEPGTSSTYTLQVIKSSRSVLEKTVQITVKPPAPEIGFSAKHNGTSANITIEKIKLTSAGNYEISWDDIGITIADGSTDELSIVDNASIIMPEGTISKGDVIYIGNLNSVGIYQFLLYYKPNGEFINQLAS